MVEYDRARRLHNQERLRELAREQGDRVRLLCSHDAFDFDRYASASAERISAGKALVGAPGAAARRDGAPPVASSASWRAEGAGGRAEHVRPSAARASAVIVASNALVRAALTERPELLEQGRLANLVADLLTSFLAKGGAEL